MVRKKKVKKTEEKKELTLDSPRADRKEPVLAIAKALYFIQKARVSCQVRETHLKRTELKKQLTEVLGRPPEEEEFDEKWEEFKGSESYISDPRITEIKNSALALEKAINKMVNDIVRDHPAYGWFSQIKGIGLLNIGKVTSLIDIEKCPKVSHLWRFAMGAPIGGDENGNNRTVERKVKKEKLHYNQILKSMCWRLGKSLIRANGKYATYYRQQKSRLSSRIESSGQKIVPSAKLPVVDGKHVENSEFFALGHLDAMAMRKMIKLFLAHLWLKWRQALSLSITEPYVQAILGHTNILSPEDMIEDIFEEDIKEDEEKAA